MNCKKCGSMMGIEAHEASHDKDKAEVTATCENEGCEYAVFAFVDEWMEYE